MQTITLDNAASNDVAIRELANNISQDSFIEINKDLFHNRCFAHILNIIVKDGLKGISEVIKKVIACLFRGYHGLSNDLFVWHTSKSFGNPWYPI